MDCHKHLEPNSLNHYNPSSHYKTRSITISLLGTRSNTGHSSIIGPYSPYMTKTSPSLGPLSNLTLDQPRYFTHHIHPIYLYRGLRRPKPNPTTEDPSILLNRPHRLNNGHHNLQPNYGTSQPNSLHPNNNHNLYTIFSQLINYHTIPVTPMKQNTPPNSVHPGNDTLTRRPTSTNRILA